MTNQERAFDGCRTFGEQLIDKMKSNGWVALLGNYNLEDIVGVATLDGGHEVLITAELIDNMYYYVTLYNVTGIGTKLFCTSKYGSSTIAPTIEGCMKEFNTDDSIQQIVVAHFKDGSSWRRDNRSRRICVHC